MLNKDCSAWAATGFALPHGRTGSVGGSRRGPAIICGVGKRKPSLDPAESKDNIAWARDFGKALESFAGDGVYVNDLSLDDADRVSVAYGANYGRLVALKKKYDPGNFFHLNPNIRPAG